ncbi:50S ribosomal protein L25 [Candidatus Gracilibacteria bacterium]|nr:50S ribosomal protein L25 [Candidatus Gracilibacteria bacterium]
MMVETFSLSAQKRDSHKHSARSARVAKRVPGIVYGKGVEAISISIENSDILRAYRKAGQSTLIELDIDGKKVKVLIHHVDLNPVKNTIQHVDFYAVNLKEKTVVNVPFHFIGESDAIKNKNGILMREHDEIEIRCFPTEIPAHIDVDISKMVELHDHITLADLNLDSKKHEVMNFHLDSVICSIAAPRQQEEEETPTPETEVIGEKKDEDSEEGSEKDEKAE